MRSTVRIDDDLMAALKAQAARDNVSLTRALNRVLRAGFKSVRQGGEPGKPFEQRTVALGRAASDLTKALEVSAALEDEEVAREITLRK